MQRFELTTKTAIAIIAILTAIVYANSLSGDFVCDDWPQIVNNKKITSYKYLPQYFTSGVWSISELEYKDQFLYRPLFLLNLFLNYQIWGQNPFGFHLTSIFLHIANSILIFFLLKKFLGTDKLIYPLIGAIIFAVHPVHVEPVSWISGVPDLLCTFFFLLSFLFYLRYGESSSLKPLTLSIIFFIFSLLSKEVAIMLPVIILGYDFSKEKKIYLNRLSIFTLVSLIYILLRITVLGKPIGTLQFSLTGLKHLVEFVAGYIKLLFIPWHLGFYFTVPEKGIVDNAGMIFSAAALGVMTFFAFKNRKSLFSLFWLFVTLLPSLSLSFYSNPTYAERFLYLPSCGFVFFLTYIVMSFQRYQRAIMLLIFLVVIVLSAITIRTNQDWRNDEVFYSKAIKNNTRRSGAYMGLAMYHERKGNAKNAIFIYMNALNYATNNEKALIYDNIAMIYGKSGLTQESIFYYQKELELNNKNSSALVGLGNNYLLKNNYKKALHYYTEAFSIDNRNYEACYNLALTHESLGNRNSAVYYYNLFLKIAPEYKYVETIRLVRKKLENL